MKCFVCVVPATAIDCKRLPLSSYMQTVNVRSRESTFRGMKMGNGERGFASMMHYFVACTLETRSSACIA